MTHLTDAQREAIRLDIIAQPDKPLDQIARHHRVSARTVWLLYRGLLVAQRVKPRPRGRRVS